MAQDRKVFVGGVPQDLNQDDLYFIFSEYAGVKKAWLQKCRTTDDGSGNNSCPPQNHRGFGFVIFHDAHAIDELIGNGPSRFIVLRSGAKLEVKRALSSNKMGQQESSASGSGQAPGSEASGRGGRGPQQAYRGQVAHDLPSNHIVGSVSQQRGPTQQGQMSDLRRRAQLAQQAQAAAAAAAALQAQGYHSGATQASLLGGVLPRVPGALPDNASYNAVVEALQQLAAGVQPTGLSAAAAMSLVGAGTTAGLPTARAPVDPALLGGSTGHPQLRDSLMRFYSEYCPEKLSAQSLIDTICDVYRGREEELDAALRQKYGTGLQLGQSRPPAEANYAAARSRLTAAAAQAAAAALIGQGGLAPGLAAPGDFGEPAYLQAHSAWGKVLGEQQMGAGAMGQAPATPPMKARGRGGSAMHLQGPWMDGLAGTGGAEGSLDEFALPPYGVHPGTGEQEHEATSPDLRWLDHILRDEEDKGEVHHMSGKGFRQQDYLAHSHSQSYAVR